MGCPLISLKTSASGLAYACVRLAFVLCELVLVRGGRRCISTPLGLSLTGLDLGNCYIPAGFFLFPLLLCYAELS